MAEAGREAAQPGLGGGSGDREEGRCEGVGEDRGLCVWGPREATKTPGWCHSWGGGRWAETRWEQWGEPEPSV